ncbi:hypothetical protein OH687_15635 [Burkholderia anthina]|nr:hypothetical protein OH687_15635 [Burkholderia anthina]
MHATGAASGRRDAGDRFGARCGEKHTHRIPDRSCIDHRCGASQQAFDAFGRPQWTHPVALDTAKTVS